MTATIFQLMPPEQKALSLAEAIDRLVPDGASVAQIFEAAIERAKRCGECGYFAGSG